MSPAAADERAGAAPSRTALALGGRRAALHRLVLAYMRLVIGTAAQSQLGLPMAIWCRRAMSG